MVKLRSQDGDSKEKEIVTEDPEEQRIARLEEFVAETKQQFAEILAKLSRLQGIQEGDDRSALDRDTSPSMKAWRSGSSHSERSGDERWFSEEDRRFRDYLMLRNDDDDETWTWTEHYSVMDDKTDSLEEESMPQFQVPVSDSETLKSIELGKVDLGLENEEYVVLNENLEQERVQKKVKTSFEADGDVGKGQKMISDANTCCAHKVFVKMPSKEKCMKHLKAWKFKFKPTSKRSRLMDDKFSFVDATVLLNKDPQEIIWDCVNKELKEIVDGCGMTRVDQRKKESEKERKWEDVRHSGSLQSYYDDQVKSTELVVRDQTQEVRSDVVYSPWVSVKRDGAVETQTCSSRRANHVWKPGGFVHPKIQLDWLERADSNHEEKQAWIENAWFKIQVHSDFDMASWVGLEIYGSETKKQTLLVFKLANRVWERGKLLATYLYWELFGLRALIWLEIHSWKYKKQINIGHISLNGMCNNLVYDEEKKELRHVGDDVKKGKNSFLRDVKIILALAVKEYRKGKAAEGLLREHYGLLHTFDPCGGLNTTVIAGTIMQPSLKLFHQLRVACLHHTSLGFLYGSLPRPPDENHSNFSNRLRYHETWSRISLQTKQDGNPVIEKLVKEEFPRESEAEVFLLDGNSLVTTISLEVDQLLRQFQELFEKLSLAEMKLRMIGRVWKSFGYWMEDMMEEDRKRRRQQKFHKTRQSKFKQQPRRNMVYTPCLRILRRGKEHGRSTQVKLFKNWKFKYKHKHPLRILSCNAQHRMKQMADQQRTEREFAIGEFLFDLQKKFPELSLNLEEKVVWRGKM